MTKSILKIVCVLLLFINAINAQPDSTIILAEGNQAKGIEVETFTTLGNVIEVDIMNELDFSMVYLQIIDKEYNDYYLTASNEDAAFSQLPKISENLVGKNVKATYTKSIEREVVKYLPAKLPDGVAGRGKEVEDKIIVYTITGTQETATETPEGWTITFRTPNGAMMNFSADEEIFNGHKPNKFDETEVKISFIEYQDFNLKELEIIE
jgi:hypothetical protein